MAQTTTGSLYVDSYTGTGNLGEYTFESGLFTNQNDTGNGAYDIVPGFVIFLTPTNVNTGFPINGISQRYVLTNVTVLDTVRVSGTILWDEQGEEVNPPAPGMFAIIAQTTANHHLAIPLIDANYPEMPPGSTIAALLNDLINIIDKLGSGGGGVVSNNRAEVVTLVVDGQTQFQLSAVVLEKENTVLTVNGLSYVYGVDFDFTIDADMVTWSNASMALEITDTVIVRYKY